MLCISDMQLKRARCSVRIGYLVQHNLFHMCHMSAKTNDVPYIELPRQDPWVGQKEKVINVLIWFVWARASVSAKRYYVNPIKAKKRDVT